MTCGQRSVSPGADADRSHEVIGDCANIARLEVSERRSLVVAHEPVDNAVLVILAAVFALMPAAIMEARVCAARCAVKRSHSSCQPGRWTIRQDVGEAMKPSGALGLYLMAGLATSAAVAASASAAAPELGRCLAKLGGTYANSSCTTIRAGVTKYEWVPGPGPKNLFTFTTKTLQQGIDLEGPR